MVGGRQTCVLAVKVFLFQRRDRQQNRKHSVMTERSGQTDAQGHGASKVCAVVCEKAFNTGWLGWGEPDEVAQGSAGRAVQREGVNLGLLECWRITSVGGMGCTPKTM